MALAAADIKPGMIVVADGLTGQWEVLDKHPTRSHWWLHRRNAAGDWEASYHHQDAFHEVCEGSRYESIQTELEFAA